MRALPRLLMCLALCLAGCGRAPADVEAPPAQPPEDPRAKAHALLDRLPAPAAMVGVDEAARELAATAHDPTTAESIDALTLAGDLFAVRYRYSRRDEDLRRAGDFFSLAARDLSRPGACTAIEHHALLLHLAADGAREGTLRTRMEAACPGARPAEPSAPTAAGWTRPRRVVLDPGHGGSDPGALGPTGLTEASVTLDVARRVADRLATRYGVQVVLTRDRDVYVALEDRAAYANVTSADMFVSLHCNAAPNPDARGISTFVLDTTSERVNTRVSVREGELMLDDPIGQMDVSRILAGLRLRQQGGASVLLADTIQRAMLHDARLLYPSVDDMGVHPANFHVLVTARMPAVLVELSFISNAAEETRLRAAAYRDVLASAISRAIATGAP